MSKKKYFTEEEKRNASRQWDKKKREENPEKYKEISRKTYNKNREKRIAQSREYQRSRSVEEKLWTGARKRARELNKEFNIDVSDIVIPDCCPIYGIPLVAGIGQAHDGSPTLDRIDNDFGYIKGNVRVISRRANSLKRDLTVSLCRRLIQYIEGEI